MFSANELSPVRLPPSSLAGSDSCGAGVDFTPPPHRAQVFSLILAGTFCGQMGLSIISPFFPKEAEAKDVSDFTLGWIFSIFELATMVGTPVAMQAMVRMGSRPLLIGGNLLGGIGNVLLGFCWYVGEGTPFILCCLALRIVAGFAFAFLSTAGYSLLPALYGPEVSTASGSMEVVNGVAMILGPVVGSLLFSAGGGEDGLGYVVPFLAIGAIEAVFAVVNLGLLPELPKAPAKRPSVRDFSWKVLLPCSTCIVFGVSLGLLGPTLAKHLSNPPLNYSVPQVGAVFAVACFAYALFAPLVGFLDDNTGGRLAVGSMAFGALLTGLGYAWLGPVPLSFGGHELELDNACAWGGAVLIGVGCAFGVIPVYKRILLYATHCDAEERDLATAAVFTLAFSSGSFLGPTLGGILSQAVGVRAAYAWVAVSLLVSAVLLACLASTPAFSLPPSISNGGARTPRLLEAQARL